MSKIVKRTLDFIELFAEHKRPLALSEISRYLEIPASSCHDVLQSLLERGYVYELAPRGGFYPTRRLQQLVSDIAEHDPVLMRAEMELRDLRDAFDESVSLARVSGLQAVYLLVLAPSHRLRFLVNVGDNIRSLHATSAGKAVLGTLDPPALNEAVDALDLEPLTENTVRTKQQLLADIESGRQRGWYLNREESVLTATTLSALFSWNRSTFIVTVAGPTHRMESKLEAVAARMIQACRRLEAPGEID